MNRFNTRATVESGTQSRTHAKHTRSLLAMVGKALGLRSEARSAIERMDGQPFEQLEQRALLEGSFATAITINLANPQSQGSSPGVINPSVNSTDNDYYTFVAPTDDFVTVLGDTANESTTSTLNTRVTVYGSASLTDVVASGTTNGTLSSGVQRDGWAGFLAHAGQRYYVVVSSDYPTGPVPNLTSGNTYTLRVDAATSKFEIGQDTGIGRENGSPPPGNPMPPLRPVLGSIGLRQQDVVYRYTAPTGPGFDSIVTVNTQYTDYAPTNLPGSSIPDRLDTRLEVYNSSGTLIASDSDAGRINDAFLSFYAQQGQTYYVRVRSDEVRPRDPNDPLFDLSLATGPFFLVIDGRSTDINIDPVTRRANEIAGQFVGFGDPTVAPVPAIPDPVFQTDSYNFTAQGDGLTIITANPTGLTPVTNPALRLYDAQGNLLAFNDNFAGTSPQIAVNLVGGRKYFVVVDGFDINSQTQYTLDIESNHTNDPTTGLDDHVNTPATGTSVTDARTAFQQATGLTWGDATRLTDADNNPLRDRSYVVSATGTGRIQGQGDTDLFQFTPQVDMQLDFDGATAASGHQALYIGGRFNRADPGSVYPVDSRGVAVWDAADYFYAGNQSFDPNFGVTYGFRDNPATPGTTQAEIYVEYDWNLGGSGGGTNTSHVLIVGGDFQLIIPTAQGPQLLTNLAAWVFSPADNRWEWSGFLGDANGAVRAVTTYDPPSAMMGGPGAGAQDFGPQIVVGGDFTTIDGTGANRIAFRDAVNPNIGWAAAGTGITNGSVNALTVYDPKDPGSGDSGNGIPDPVDPPPLLIIGGQFTGNSAGGTFMWDTGGGAYQNIASSPLGPGGVGRLYAGNPNGTITSIINGPVFALAVADDPIGSTDGTGATPDSTLFIGGQFTNAGGKAATNLVAWGQVPRTDQMPPPRPLNVLGWSAVTGTGALNGGANTSVRALTVWNIPATNNAPQPAPVLVIGGQFTAAAANSANVQNNIILWTGTRYNALLAAGNGTNGIVRTLSTVVDTQEPSIDYNLLGTNPQEVLYVGGDFTTVSNNVMAAPVQAAHVAQFSAFHNIPFNVDFFQWTRLNGGVGYVNTTTTPIATVFALAGFDDSVPGTFGRHDRAATRLSVTVTPVDGSFINSRIRVFDSNFNVVYGFDRPGSDTISPPFPDPSGMIDPSLSTPNRATQYDGIKVWGGEVYYLEVSDVTGGGTGRYSISVTADGLPPDVNGDGVRDQTNATFVSTASEGQFSTAQAFLTNAAGDTQNVGNVASGNNPAPTSQEIFHVNPSTGTQLVAMSDYGNISTYDDTNLWSFRAEASGYAEVRVSTAQIPDQFGQYELVNGALTFVSGTTKNYDSNLDTVIRVFRNDFEQIGYNDDNNVLPGARGEFPSNDPNNPNAGSLGTNVGIYNDVIFNRTDSRVVFPVVAGNNYYVQVEGANRYSSGASGIAANRTPTIARERDVRSSTGSYRLFINAMPTLDTDIENGVPVQDDHFDLLNGGSNGRAIDAFATPIDIGDNLHGVNGAGSATGIINNTPRKPNDIDLFAFTSPGTGPATITVTPANGSALTSRFQIINADPNSASYGQVVANSSPLGLGASTAQVAASRGSRFVIAVSGGGGTSEGAYTVSVSGVPVVDDYSDAFKLWNAQDVTLRDFLGQGQISGVINTPGDSDIFRYSFNDAYLSMTVNVTSTDTTLRPQVTVYEVSEDLSGNPILLRIGFNSNAAGAASVQTTAPLTPNRTTLPASGPARNYPYYYVVVKGIDPTSDIGNYNLTISFPATDDHPDGDTNGDGILDTGEFPFASRIIIDPNSGEGTATGIIERSSDSDLFQFTSPASGPTTVTVSLANGSLLRQRITLLGSDGTIISQVTAADTTTPTSQSLTISTVRDVTYYLVVQPYEDPLNPNVNTATTGAYTVDVQTPPVDDYPNIGEYSLAAPLLFDRTTGLAAIGGNAVGDSSNAVISPSTDTDLFTFTPLIAGNQAISVTPFSGTRGDLWARVRVFQQVGTNYVELADMAAAAAGQTVTYNLNATSTSAVYFVLVTTPASATAPNTTGEYRVQVQGPVPNTGGGGSDPAAIDFNAATNINLNTRTGAGQSTDAINPAGDRDVFTFRSLAASGQAFVQLIAPNGSLLRASVRVLSAPNENQSSEVAFDSQGIPGAIANTSFTAAANTQYWVVVDGLGDSVGSYTVRVLVPPSVYQLVYPEGFANDNIAEFVSLVNPNSTNVSYSIYLRYEWGDTAEFLAAQGTVVANSRDGLTIQDRANYRLPGLETGVPYSIVIESSQPLGATLAHYDLGGSLGDSFSSTGSSEWTFARVERTAGVSADFAIFYNLNDFDVNVTLTAYQNGQTYNVATQTVGARRRGGWDINNANLASLLPRGVFSIKLTASPANSANAPIFQGIVASLSHYNVSNGSAFGLIGDPAGGATTGIVTNITQGPQVSSEIVLFNPGTATAIVTLSGTYISPNLPTFNRQLTIAPNTQLVVSGTSLGLIPDQAAGVLWKSNQKIVVGSDETQLGDADSTQPATSAGTRYFFGDGYINPASAGSLNFESVFLANPTNTDLTVSVKILFIDATTSTFSVNVPANGFAQVKMHERPEILNKVGSPWYSLDLSSALPFVASMQHYDLSYGGGWATSGVPLGFVQSLDSIIS